MPALSASDAERLLRFVADAESIGGDQPITPDLLVEVELTTRKPDLLAWAARGKTNAELAALLGTEAS